MGSKITAVTSPSMQTSRINPYETSRPTKILTINPLQPKFQLAETLQTAQCLCQLRACQTNKTVPDGPQHPPWTHKAPRPTALPYDPGRTDTQYSRSPRTSAADTAVMRPCAVLWQHFRIYPCPGRTSLPYPTCGTSSPTIPWARPWGDLHCPRLRRRAHISVGPVTIVHGPGVTAKTAAISYAADPSRPPPVAKFYRLPAPG